MRLKAICPKCKTIYRGWALEQEEHQYCRCGTKLVMVTEPHKKTLLQAVRR